MTKCYIKDYPRPQFVRNDWENLNGAWDFSFDDEKVGEADRWFASFPAQKEIQVPFTYETKMSGIGDETCHEAVWYHRTVSVSAETLQEKKTILHFEGSDYVTKVWVNGNYVGSHTGGYARFSFDITKELHAGENDIVVKAEDSFDTQQPRGKQRWEPENFGCWYVQTTGIWKTVWMEFVPKNYLQSVKMTPMYTDHRLDVEFDVNADHYGKDLMVEAEIYFGDIFVNAVRIPVTKAHIQTSIDVYSTDVNDFGIARWHPDDPNLYDITFTLLENGEEVDHVGSYFGMRDIRISGNQILLSNDTLYQRLILDQGYWKDSHLTPPSEEALIEDIDKIMQLGYNGVRKHQKVEDERFLYWCDVKGLLVWSEMASAYRFTDEAVAQFVTQWTEIVRQNYNHPSIITWTPFNESWGVPFIHFRKPEQHFTETVYYLTKTLDPFRPVIVNDGWEHTISDILTLHDYQEIGDLLYNRYTQRKDTILKNEEGHCHFKFALAEGYEYKGQPIIISEYGGIAFNNSQEGWGYGNKVADEDAFLKRFDDITTAIKKLPYVCGYCYTQVSDVQQEINGLMDMDRNFKVNADAVREINLKNYSY